MKINKKIQFLEVTPKAHKCIIGACPSLFKTNRNSYVVVGKILDEDDTAETISKKVGDGEFAVEIPASIINDYLNQIKN